MEKACSKQHGKYRVRPSVESLEDRAVPATILVTSNADAGPNTLRQAIIDMNSDTNPDADVINIQAGVDPALTTAQLTINRLASSGSLSIVGLAPTQNNITGNLTFASFWSPTPIRRSPFRMW
ncbi:MAG: hypothetical protein K2R98_09955 [Gemmataceae bacterium]|nr:hypothetical protein [Gemmataceae bacterium]